MTKKEPEQKHSIEEILHSIRLSISEETENEPAALTRSPLKYSDMDNVLELTDVIQEDGSVIPLFQEDVESVDFSQSLLHTSSLTGNDSNEISFMAEKEEVKQIVRELLHPILEDWLNRNIEDIWNKFSELNESRALNEDKHTKL